jgi:hypothetical protein
MNFLWDGALADVQDRVFASLSSGLAPAESDIKQIKSNWLISIASYLSPCNLTVRHYCLLDLLSGKPNHQEKIESQCDLLSNDPYAELTTAGNRLWIEGYCYWGYTKSFLLAYCHKFNPPWLPILLNILDDNFRKTSYERNGISYPAPFGDIYDIPLEDSLQQPKGQSEHGWIGPVRKSLPAIRVHTKVLRFNLHTNNLDTCYDVTSGIPIDMQTNKPFQFYAGYKEKYPTLGSQIKALLSWSRFISLFTF